MANKGWGQAAENQLDKSLLAANSIELIDADLWERADSSRCKPSIA